MSDEPELRPCPFCGGVEHEIGYDSAGYDVQCHSWTCRAKTGSHATEAEAIAAWNRRGPIVAHTDILIVDPDRPTPSRESSDELAALAAKYLGMDEEAFVDRMDPFVIDGEDSVRAVFADIKRLAGSVVSQARGDK